MNKTRIKVVSDKYSTYYECQSYWGFFWGWNVLDVSIDRPAVFDTLTEAKLFIDGWVVKRGELDQQNKDTDIRRKEKKRTRKIEYIDYP